MAYATSTDLVTIYSASVIDRVAFNPEIPGRDSAMIARALDEATAEIDTHLSAAYPVPIDPTPPILRQLCVDITVYRMALTFDKMTDEITVRYGHATRLLERIASGSAGLGIRTDTVTPDTPEIASGATYSIDAMRT